MNYKLNSLVAAALAGSLMMGFGANAMADSTDDIVNALVSKGVLTEEEGALLMKGRTGEKEAAAAKKDSEIKASFKDGIKFESGDKANSLSINGRIQADYRVYDEDQKDTKVPDTFDVRRAYLTAKGTFAKYYEFAITANFADKDDTTTSKSNQLDEAFINLHYWDQAQFKFGQFKMPFSLEEQTSSRFIDFQERSLLNKMVTGKEMGAMVHGEPTKGVVYGLALSTGNGKNNNESGSVTDDVEYIGRVAANFAEIMGNKDNVYHVGAAFATTELEKDTVSANTESKGLGYLKADLAPTTAGKTIDRDRFGLEGAVAFGPVKLQSEYIKTDYDLGSTSVDVDGWYAEALWLITGENYADSYKGGKFDRIKPKNNFNPDGAGMGAWEVGFRYSDLDASDLLSNGVAKAGVTGFTSADTAEAKSYTVGIKWIPMPNWRFMANYVKTDYDTDIKPVSKLIDSEEAFTVRAQMDF